MPNAGVYLSIQFLVGPIRVGGGHLAVLGRLLAFAAVAAISPVIGRILAHVPV
jgi:hypothetical protein